jgi:hypothetical protein
MQKGVSKEGKGVLKDGYFLKDVSVPPLYCSHLTFLEGAGKRQFATSFKNYPT